MSEPGIHQFDLTREPWITVRFADGRVDDVSLRDAFGRADEIREIVGEVPTQTFAIVRLLLAILYRVVPSRSLDAERWRELWDRGLPLPELDEYLNEHSAGFDLLSPDRPFFQVADLHTAKGEVKDVAQLIFDLPSNNRLFTTRAGSGIERLSFAEAARWLVNTQAFDPSGIKSGALGDPRVTGGKGYPIGLAWAGHLGGVLVEGSTLRETLLLNLVGTSPYWEAERDDPPVWERADLDGPAEREWLRIRGPVALYTWQSRRIRLVSDGAAIVGSLITNGDKLTPQNGQARGEAMSAWRYSEPQTKKAGTAVYMPREHQPARAFWRGISALLPKSDALRAGKDAARSLPPGSVQWISLLQAGKYLTGSHLLGLRAIGVIYGSNSSVISEVIDDRVIVSLALLNETNTDLSQIAETAVQAADEGVWALRRLAENLDKAAGGDGTHQRAEESAYAALDAPYRRWLSDLGPETDAGEALRTWKAIARGILRKLGDELIAAAGPAAWVGREISLRAGNQPEILNTARAENWFWLALKKSFDDPAPAAREETVNG